MLIITKEKRRCFDQRPLLAELLLITTTDAVCRVLAETIHRHSCQAYVFCYFKQQVHLYVS